MRCKIKGPEGLTTSLCDADHAGGYAAAPLLWRDHAGRGGRLGSADGGAGAGAGGGTPDAVGIWL